MAEVQLNLIPAEFVKIIPVYNGDQRQLNLFIRKCEYIISKFRGNDDQNSYVMETITSRLTGDAAALISERGDIATWADFRELLVQHFGDPRSEECVAIELETLKIKSGESYLDFCNRVQSVRATLISKVNFISDEAMRTSKIIIYNRMALNVFLFNLSENMIRIVRLHKPETLEKALSIVLEEVNFQEQYQSKHKTNNMTSPPKQQTPFRFGNHLPSPSYQGVGFRPFFPPQNQFNAQPNFKFGINPNMQYKPFPNNQQPLYKPNNTQFPQHGNRPNNPPAQFGYRPNLGFGYPQPHFGYRPNLQPAPPMRPQQFGQYRLPFKPPQQVPPPNYSNDVSMRTAPQKRQGLLVNEMDINENEYPYYEVDPYNDFVPYYVEDPSAYCTEYYDDEQSASAPTLAYRDLGVTDKPETSDHVSRHDEQQVQNFCVVAPKEIKK